MAADPQMIVHFIGNAGTGKTTLMANVAAQGGYTLPPMGFRRILSAADWMLPIALPLVWPIGCKLSPCNRKGKNGPSPWAWTQSVAMQRARQQVLTRGQVCLVDQGMTNMLRRHANESAESMLDDLPLPDIVVNVTAPSAVRKARIVTRDKPDDAPSRHLSGDRALEVGGNHARQWLALYGAEQAMHYLRAWSQWQCRPELDDNELRSLLEHARETPLIEKDEAALRCEPLPQSWLWLHDGFVERGVKWINVVNDGREAPEALAVGIVQEINRLKGNKE